MIEQGHERRQRPPFDETTGHAVHPRSGQFSSTSTEALPGPARSDVPLVSVGLPVYNGERFLEAAMRSILDQTFDDLELIVSDNGSTDATPDIVRELSASDPRIRYIRVADNRGAMWNFNEVFRQSRGRYFKPAAHDDLHEPTFLERCLEVYREAPSSVVLVHPRTTLIDGDDEVIGVQDDHLQLVDRDPARRLQHYLRHVKMVNPLFGLHRRDAFASTRGFQSFVSADVVLLAELAMRGEFWEIPEPLFLRRDHEGRSERAHASIQELAAFYDPDRRLRLSGRQTRVFWGLLRAAIEAPLSPGARLRCLRSVALDYGWHAKRGMVTELLSAVPGVGGHR